MVVTWRWKLSLFGTICELFDLKTWTNLTFLQRARLSSTTDPKPMDRRRVYPTAFQTTKELVHLFHFVICCLPRMMESHHQNMKRLIAKWHYQQEKGLTWKEWAEGILDGQPVEGALQERTNLSRQGMGHPESAVPSWYSPMPEDVLVPPVVSASSGSSREEPQ